MLQRQNAFVFQERTAEGNGRFLMITDAIFQIVSGHVFSSFAKEPTAHVLLVIDECIGNLSFVFRCKQKSTVCYCATHRLHT